MWHLALRISLACLFLPSSSPFTDPATNTVRLRNVTFKLVIVQGQGYNIKSVKKFPLARAAEGKGDKLDGTKLENLLNSLPEERRESFFSQWSQEKVGKGQLIFMEGEKASHVYVVERGIVEAVNIYDDGRVYIHGFLFPCDLLGEPLLYGRDKQPYSAIAREESVLWKIKGEAFLFHLRENPGMEEFIRFILGDKLEQYLFKARCIAGERVERRIACVLMKVIHERGINVECRPKLDLPLTNRDIAGLVGSTEETVSRVMSRLKKEQVLGSEGKYLVIKDPDKLRSYFDEL